MAKFKAGDAIEYSSGGSIPTGGWRYTVVSIDPTRLTYELRDPTGKKMFYKAAYIDANYDLVSTMAQPMAINVPGTPFMPPVPGIPVFTLSIPASKYKVGDRIRPNTPTGDFLVTAVVYDASILEYVITIENIQNQKSYALTESYVVGNFTLIHSQPVPNVASPGSIYPAKYKVGDTLKHILSLKTIEIFKVEWNTNVGEYYYSYTSLPPNNGSGQRAQSSLSQEYILIPILIPNGPLSSAAIPSGGTYTQNPKTGLTHWTPPVQYYNETIKVGNNLVQPCSHKWVKSSSVPDKSKWCSTCDERE